ncbi:MAG: AraC-like DNA-binding protein [Parasphingorhabdus sp.]
MSNVSYNTIDDGLSAILKALRLNGVIYFQQAFPEPWAMQCGESPYGQFHLVVSGSCMFGTGKESEVKRFNSGDLVLLPWGSQHWIGSSATALHMDGMTVVESCVSGESIFADGPESCTLICGHFECDRLLNNPLLDELPDCIYLKNGGSLNNHWLDGAVSMLVQETSGSGSGFEAITSRLVKILYIQIIQAHIHEHGIEVGFLAALSDKQICRALHYVHNNYSSEVSVSEMARVACMPHTSLSAKFNALVGMPPGTYTTKWRMLKASELLSTTRDSISAVAMQVDYRDESAFSRAFKNEYDSYPGAWRREMLALRDQKAH